MPAHQSIGGWTIHLFTRYEIARLLGNAGFRILEILPVGLGPRGEIQAGPLPVALRAYGYLIAAEVPEGAPRVSQKP